MYRIRFYGCGSQGMKSAHPYVRAPPKAIYEQGAYFKCGEEVTMTVNWELVPLLLGLIFYIVLGLAIIVRSLRHMHNP